MTRRSRPLVILAGLVVAGIVMLSWTQTWFTLQLHASTAVEARVQASGSVAASSYTALALASLALFLALTIAGRVVRVVLGLVQVALGVAIVVEGISAVSDPVRASASAVTTVTGVNDLTGVRNLVATQSTTIWPWVGIVGGALALILGLVVLIAQRTWPGPSRKYSATPTSAQRTAPVARDAVVDWDDLSAGVDPTDGTVPTGAEIARDGAREDNRHRVGLGSRQEPTRASDDKEHREQH